MNIRPALQAAPAYHFSAKYCKVKLDQNESPFPLPRDVKEAIEKRIRTLELNRYPELNAHTARQLLAQNLDWDANGIVLSGGSNILIQALVIAAGIGQTVLTVAPSFSVYSLQANLLGSKLIELPLNSSFDAPMDALLDALATHEGIFFLANPAAPTANLIPQEAIHRLAKASAKNWLMVIDEAYHQFSNTDYSYLIKSYPHVVCLRTFSKAYGLGGVRLGYALMQNDLAENIQKAIMPFSISALQLAIAETVLEQNDYVQQNVDLILKERERVYEKLKGFDTLTVYPSATNFILFRYQDAEQLYNNLLKHGVLIRRQDHLPHLEGCLRVSIGTNEENGIFLNAMENILKKDKAHA